LSYPNAFTGYPCLGFPLKLVLECFNRVPYGDEIFLARSK